MTFWTDGVHNLLHETVSGYGVEISAGHICHSGRPALTLVIGMAFDEPVSEVEARWLWLEDLGEPWN